MQIILFYTFCLVVIMVHFERLRNDSFFLKVCLEYLCIIYINIDLFKFVMKKIFLENFEKSMYRQISKLTIKV